MKNMNSFGDFFGPLSPEAYFASFLDILAEANSSTFLAVFLVGK